MISTIKFRRERGDLPHLIFHDDRDKLPNSLFKNIMDWLIMSEADRCTLAMREITLKSDFTGIATWKRRRLKVNAGKETFYYFDAAIGVDPIVHQVLGPLRRIEKKGESIFEQPAPGCLRGRPVFYWEVEDEEREALPKSFGMAFYCPVTQDLFPEDYCVHEYVTKARSEYIEALRKRGESVSEPDSDLDSEFLDVEDEPVESRIDPDSDIKCPEERFLEEMPDPLKTSADMAEDLKNGTVRKDQFEPVNGINFEVITVRKEYEGEIMFSTMVFRPDGLPVLDHAVSTGRLEDALHAHNERVVFIRENVRRYGYSTGRI